MIPKEMLLSLDQFEGNGVLGAKEFEATMGRIVLGDTHVSLSVRITWPPDGSSERVWYVVKDLTQPKDHQILCITPTVQEGIDFLNSFVEEEEGK